MSGNVFEAFLSTPDMASLFAERSVLQAMLDFESALARSQADEGVIDAAAASVIAHACRVDQIDGAGVVAASGRAGSLAIPLVKQLTAAVERIDLPASTQVHWGATSQDVIDTAMVLCTRKALALIDRDLTALVTALLALADRHADAPVLARTLMQPASVTSFGFKLAQWAEPLVRAQERLHASAAAALQLQLGGAVGTLAVMGEKGPAVARRMASLLGLPEPHGAWHTRRDDWVRLGAEVGVLCGSLGKIARDWSLMAQGEIGELAEPSGAGRGGSSAMPHKRNPVASMVALAAALRAPQRVAALLQAMPQEHERGLGNWQAELAEWAGLFISAHGAVSALAEAAAGLQVDTARMRVNIESLHGLVSAEAAAMRLAEVIGKPKAQSLLERLSRRVVADGVPLAGLVQEAVAADLVLRCEVPAADIDALFDPDVAATAAKARAAEALVRLKPRAAASAAALSWAAWLPSASA